MQLQTQVNSGTYPHPPLEYGEGIITFGSCFSEHIGKFLQDLGHNIVLNPFGVLYNPIIICQLIRRLLKDKPYTLDELIEYDGLFHSFDHHGTFSSTGADKTLAQINKSYEKGKEALAKARFVLITWGTAFIYEHIKQNRVVANCHKIPAQNFRRRLYSIEELSDYVKETFALLLKAYPNLQIITTVSPIRHLRDGAHQNQLSKATLLLMNEMLQKAFPNAVHYFPAYEILLDELRDYRFYASDMTHPSDLTIEHIKERFATYLISEKSQELGQKVTKLKRQWEHRPLHPDHPDYPRQRKLLQERIHSCLKDNPKLLLPWFED